ncbi:MAG: FadR/GntR family transcriptional regulator [Acidimicrobiales bacterium]
MSLPPPESPEVASRTASEAIAEQIRSQIATGTLRPGDMLPSERVLLETYDVATPTMRGALRILESDGLISVERGVRGGPRVVVPEITALARRVGLHLQLRGTRLRELIEVQGMIQPGAAALAARARDDEDLVRLRAAVTRCAEAEAVDELVSAVEGFGDAVLRASHNHVLTLYAELTGALLRVGLGAYVSESGISVHQLEESVRSSARQFEVLVDLIEAGDSGQAEQFWRDYLRRTGAVPVSDPSPFEQYGPK